MPGGRNSAAEANLTQPFPTVPIHQNLPMPDRLDLSQPKMALGFAAFMPFIPGAASTSETVAKFCAHLEELNQAARLSKGNNYIKFNKFQEFLGHKGFC